MKINWQKHPQAGKKSLKEIEEEIFLSSINHGVLLMCGSWFTAEKNAVSDTLFMRATYAAAPSDKINEAIRRFGESLRENFGLTSKAGNGHVENGHAG
jgi:aromatic amino acid aminotransferase I / 2-aminoadipate transaminase